MYFINEEYEQNFYRILNEVNLSRNEDVQYEAAFYILAVPGIYKCRQKPLKPHEFPFKGMTKYIEQKEYDEFSHPALTGSTKRMCEFGLSLFNGTPVSLDNVFGSVVKEELREALFQAMKIRLKM